MRPDETEGLCPNGQLPAGDTGEERQEESTVVRLPETEPAVEGVLPAAPGEVSAESAPEDPDLIRLPKGILSYEQVESLADAATKDYILSDEPGTRRIRTPKWRLIRTKRRMHRLDDIKKPAKHRVMVDPQELQKYLSRDVELNRLKQLLLMPTKERLELAKKVIMDERIRPTNIALEEVDRQIKDLIDQISSLPRDKNHRPLVVEMEKLTLTRQALLRRARDAEHAFKYPRCVKANEIERDIRKRVHRLTAEYAFSPIHDAKLKIRKIYGYWGKIRNKYSNVHNEERARVLRGPGHR